jgi:uroporphyrinogen III methyltransferase/synthase
MEGKVYLVGAGPGDEGLITVKGLEVLRQADVVVYDYLSNEAFLNHCKESAEKIYVGKRSGNHTMKQEDINLLLANKAKEGKKVVRLKGGDPYVFGRGGEEGKVLDQEGVSFEVVPGITSAIAGLSYAGIPVTHRNVASSFHVFTAHFKDERDQLNWPIIAKLEGTLVFLMGVAQLEEICQKLIDNHKSTQTPVAIIENATTPNQRVAIGTLTTIVEEANRLKIKPPGLIVVGDVVKERVNLNWFENLPLFGEKIILTRAKEKNTFLEQNLKALGAHPHVFSSIRISPIEENISLATGTVKAYTYLVFSSKEAVTLFFEGLYRAGKDARALAHLKIVAIGEPTKNLLQAYGVIADIVPQNYVGEGLVEALEKVVTKEDKLLFPRSKQARTKTVDELKKLCSVDEISIYDTLEEKIQQEKLLDLLSEGVGGITFTSASTVHHFMSRLEEDERHKLSRVKLFSIGPMTSAAIKEYGLVATCEAKEHTLEGLLAAIVETYTKAMLYKAQKKEGIR